MEATRVKICGVTRVADAVAAAEAGAAFVGVIAYAPGRRREVTPDVARAVASSLEAGVAKVAVVVNPPPDVVRRLVDDGFDLIQHHGRLTPGRLSATPGRVTVAVSHAAGVGDWLDTPGVAGVTIDAPGGGTGHTLDWHALRPLFERHRGRPLTLAGGLTPDNVADAVHLLRPWCVDVSSGVEGAHGRKDAAGIARFIEAVRHADGCTGG